MSAGQRIKNLRGSIQPKLSQTAFGDKIGISRDAVNNLENGRVEPSESVLLLISKTFGVCYDWLKNGTEPMYPPESDDLLVKLTRIMEGESKTKLELIELIADMPDALLDQLVDYYKSKQKKED